MTTLNDYQKQPREHYGVERWYRITPITTPHGQFDVLLVTDKAEELDDAMLVLADEASAYVAANSAYIADILFAHLNRMVEDWGDDIVFDEEPFEGEPVPRDITADRIINAYDGGTVEVNRFGREDKPHMTLINFAVPFDPEHGLRLRFEDGRITQLNDSAFHLEDGQLIYDEE